MRSPAAAACTTSTIGVSATISASAPAPTASSATPLRASCADAGRPATRKAYLAAPGGQERIGGDAPVGADELPFEYMLNALRLIDGVPLADFAERTGLPTGRIAPALAAARERGWLTSDPDLLRPTPLGQRFLNDVIGGFLD